MSEPDKVVRKIRAATRRHFTSEEKIESYLKACEDKCPSRGQEFSNSLSFLEVDTAGSLGNVFRFGPWVFSAIHGAEGVDFADGLALGVKFKPGADIGELAAGAAANTVAPAVF
ncbi:MAG: hypothetical protein ABSB11_09330 [Sedimentisphaerales bacterium]|jgi:hypothetical protein